MDKKTLKKVTAKAVREWIDGLPDDGEYRDPELITERCSGDGCPSDGDYVLIIVFHNDNESEVEK